MRLTRSLLLSLLAAAPVVASPPGPAPFTVEALWGIARVGAPSPSPDGHSAVAEVTTYDLDDSSSASDLFVFGEDGAPPRRLTTHAAKDSTPKWSPDGTLIAFVSARENDEQPQLYVISPAGGEARRVTEVPTGVHGIRWLPDSKHVAFLSDVWPDLATDAEQAARLKTRSDSKVKAKVISQTQYRYWDKWLDDGRVPQVFIADVAAGTWRNLLANTKLWLRRTEVSEELYDIDPAGSELAITVDHDAADPGFEPESDLVLVSASGAGVPVVVAKSKPGNDMNPRYSPDGRYLAFLRQPRVTFYADKVEIALLDRQVGTSGGEARTLTASWDRSAQSVEWSRDASRLLFAAEDSGRQPLWELVPGNGLPRPVLAGHGVYSNAAVSAGGSTLVCLHSTTDVPPHLRFVPLAGGPASGASCPVCRRAAELPAWKLGKVEERTISGFGGEPIQMFVVYPPGFDPARRWPLLQVIHGGPHNAWLDSFSFRWNLHLFAARGYVVIVVNYHGSSSFGQAFNDSIIGRFGEKELVDLERGTDAMLAEGFIDPNRLAAAGASYGGFLVAYLNGHTDRYKAFVCHGGVFDWVANMSCDTTRGRDRSMGGFYWDNERGVARQSARSYAKRFRTPTLISHGEQDFRVPVNLGLEYYGVLRMLGVPSRLVYFPDEAHWILKPGNHRLWCQEVFNWLETYAPPGGRPT
jgi:dipeptidyl aminopeptidase/acylaminoacyl peptidase